jgi:uncharacterized protein YbjT (DUF2867 family)
MQQKTVLVTGATGYIGGRLVPLLLEAGYYVKAAGRSLEKLKTRAWAKHPNVTLVQLDVLKPESLRVACAGAEAAFYLVHSMNPQSNDFAKTDRQAAENMREAVAAEGVQRLIYLGGLGESDASLSKHLRSRHEVADILAAGQVPTTILRAGMIIGSGSASFEILRYLVERLPIMITPRWVQTPCQPIGVRNVLHYLVKCLETPETTGRTFDIGGPQVISYDILMRIFAEEAGLGKRIVMPVPVFTPRLSSYWIHLVTPVPAYIARPLAEGLKNPVVCQDDTITRLIPQRLLTCREAINLALQRIQQELVETHWTDAGAVPVEWANSGDPAWAGGTCYVDHRSIVVDEPIDEVWNRITKLGGKVGWYHGNWLWHVRGFMDRVIGGVGLTRGRRSATTLTVGDALDFWRVLYLTPQRHLVLYAEMKLPGVATLEFKLSQEPNSTTRLEQIARFKPRGLLGLIYWFLVTPLHEYVFNGMLTSLASQTRSRIISGPTSVA